MLVGGQAKRDPSVFMLLADELPGIGNKRLSDLVGSLGVSSFDMRAVIMSEIVSMMQCCILLLVLVLCVLTAASSLGIAKLEAMHPPRGQFVEVQGVRLHVAVLGCDTPADDPPIVLIHGSRSLSRLSWFACTAQTGSPGRGMVGAITQVAWAFFYLFTLPRWPEASRWTDSGCGRACTGCGRCRREPTRRGPFRCHAARTAGSRAPA